VPLLGDLAAFNHMNLNRKIVKLLTLASLSIGVIDGCALFPGAYHPGWKRYVSQQIPITVQKNKPVVFEMRVRNDSNGVGIQCAPEVWRAITNGGADQITIKLVSSSKPGTEIYWVRPGWLTRRPNSEGGGLAPAGMAFLIPNAQFLCGIAANHRGTASVRIEFPDGPDEPAPAEIIVMKNPSDLGL